MYSVLCCYDHAVLKGWVTGGAIPSESSRYSSMRSRRTLVSAESRRSRSAPRRLRALATLSTIAAAYTVRMSYRSAGIVMETARYL